MGNYPEATAVFDVDSIGLTNIVNGLNQASTSAAIRSARRPLSCSASAPTPAH